MLNGNLIGTKAPRALRRTSALLGLVAGGVATALAVRAWREKRAHEPVEPVRTDELDAVDVCSMGSFPASDPPSFTPIVSIGSSR